MRFLRMAIFATAATSTAVATAQYGDYGGYYVPAGSLSFGGDYLYGGAGYSSGYFPPAYGSPYRYGRFPHRSFAGRADYGPLSSHGRWSRSFDDPGFGGRFRDRVPPGSFDAEWLDRGLRSGPSPAATERTAARPTSDRYTAANYRTASDP